MTNLVLKIANLAPKMANLVLKMANLAPKMANWGHINVQDG